jgi:hypothetical protein
MKWVIEFEHFDSQSLYFYSRIHDSIETGPNLLEAFRFRKLSEAIAELIYIYDALLLFNLNRITLVQVTK